MCHSSQPIIVIVIVKASMFCSHQLEPLCFRPQSIPLLQYNKYIVFILLLSLCFIYYVIITYYVM